MHAVIFAAGRGTRMGAICHDRPKPLIKVAGKSILSHALLAMPDSIERVIIVVGHLQKTIRAEKDIAGRKDITIVEQPRLTGTYDALLTAKPYLPHAPFLVMNGDDIYAKEGLDALTGVKPFAVMTKQIERPNRYSHLETYDAKLTRIVPRGHLSEETRPLKTRAYTGVALLDPSFFDLEPATIPRANAVPGAGAERSLPHTLEKHLAHKPVHVIESSLWLPVGTPEELAKAERALAKD